MVREYIYKGSRSNFGYLAVLYFDHGFLELLLSPSSEIDGAVVCLGQPMRITEDEATFAFGTQQAYLLVTRVASLAVLLEVLLLDLLRLFGKRGHFEWFLGDNGWRLYFLFEFALSESRGRYL